MKGFMCKQGTTTLSFPIPTYNHARTDSFPPHRDGLKVEWAPPPPTPPAVLAGGAKPQLLSGPTQAPPQPAEYSEGTAHILLTTSITYLLHTDKPIKVSHTPSILVKEVVLDSDTVFKA